MYGRFVVETVDVPEQVVITETRHVLAGELPAWIGASLGRLEEAARECGGVTAAPFVVYHAEVSMESDGPAESCVPVADEAAARAWARSTGGRGRRRYGWSRPGGWPTPGSPRHRWRTRRSWPPSRRWRSGWRRRVWRRTGPCREVYFADWEAAGAEDPVCDVAFPVS